MQMKKYVLILIALALAVRQADAMNNTATSSGNWNAAGIWDKGHIPQSAEDVFVPTGFTVTNNGVNNYSINSLSIAGTQPAIESELIE